MGKLSIRKLAVAYGISGACSLVYQVVWYHAFVDQLGASATTFLVVLCCFIGGLGLGAVMSRPVCHYLKKRWPGQGIRLYGWLEINIAGSVLVCYGLTRLPLRLMVGSFPYVITSSEGISMYEPTWWYVAVKFLLALVAVGAPCLIMGITFPFLCSLYPGQHRLPSRLYAANTLGACTAVLVTEFLGLAILGYYGCLIAAVAGNLALGLYFVNGPGSTSCSAVKPREQTPPGSGGPSIFPAVVGGLLCGGWQALCYALIKMTLGPTRGVFALLAFFSILGIWFASSIIHRWHPSKIVLIASSWLGLGWCVALWYVEPNATQAIVLFGVNSMPEIVSPHGAAVVTAVLAVGLLIFIPYTLWSLLLPDVCDRQHAAGYHLARTYGLNTLAFLGGVLLFGWALQLVNVFFAARVFAVTATVCLAAVSWLSWTRPARWERLVMAGLATVVVVLVLPRDLEMRLVIGLRADQKHVIESRSSPDHLIWVNDQYVAGSLSLMFDRHSMSGDGIFAQAYMRGMAHLPLLLRDDPKSALLICFGVGSTADAIRQHPSIDRLDVVDLNRPVFLLNHYFASTNNSVLSDPRLRLFNDDGRQFLDLVTSRYDLVTLEPPPPLQPGISRLYSMDFYRSARRKLNPGGLLSQWLPESQMDDVAVNLIVASFVRSFEYSLLMIGSRRDLILIGSDQPFALRGVSTKLQIRRKVRRDLERLGIKSTTELLARIMRFSQSMSHTWDLNHAVIRDGFTTLETRQISPVEQLHPRSEYRRAKPNLVFDTAGVVAELEAQGIDSSEISRLQAFESDNPSWRAMVPEIYRASGQN